MGKVKNKPKKKGKAKPLPEVMTLAEAAAFLRVSEDQLLLAVEARTIPNNRICDEPRFFRVALEQWLTGGGSGNGVPLPDDHLFKKSMSAVSPGRSRTPEERQNLLDVIGSMSDDESWEPMVEQIYRERARHIVGDDS